MTNSTLTVKEAWESDIPIFGRLPESYRIVEDQENQLVKTLTDYSDSLYVQKYAQLRDTLRQVTWEADEEWLDMLGIMSGYYGFWNKSWDPVTKRCLIDNAYGTNNHLPTLRNTLLGINGGIWQTKGTLATLQYVIDARGILANVILDGDFIIGTNEVGDPIGIAPWSITVKVPPSYPGTIRIGQLDNIMAYFKPLWVKHRYVVDAETFSVINILSTGDAALVDELDNGFIQSIVEL